MKPLFTLLLFIVLLQGKAQLPVCTANHIIYTMTEDGIYNIDLSQPTPVAVLNSIKLPTGAFGLAVSANLNAPSPAITFYTIVNGTYRYYDGTSWVNTNDSAGIGVNIGGGGGYIYNYSIDQVTRYDGKGNAIPIATLPGIGSVADLSGDCSGNFYHLHNGLPQTLTKYSPSGDVLNVYTVTGAPVFSGGGGLVVFGNDVYYDDLSSSTTFPPLLHGTITGNTVNFVPAGFTIKLALDMASCPGNLVSGVPSNVSVCDNHLPYIWNGQSYTQSGTYTTTLTSASGCDSIATMNLTIKPAVTSSVNVTVCSAQLPYNWNGQNYNAQGTYTALLTAASGCDSLATLNLSVSQSPTSPLVTTPLNYCQFQLAQPLLATGTGTIQWYMSAVGGTASSISPLPSTAVAGTVIYYASQSIEGCESPRAAVTVNVLESPDLGSDKKITLCNGTSTSLNSLYNTAGSATSWYFNQMPVADPAQVFMSGQYQLIATKASGCVDTAWVTVTVQPPVMAFAGKDDSTEILVPYQLSGSGGLQYQWSPGPPLLNDANIPDPVARLTDNTSFSLIVRDAAGCEGYDTVTIKVFRGPGIRIPSAFTPNGDGLNDILHPLGAAIEKLDYFRVYNRYGELIFETSDPTKGWDGTYKGQLQSTGNYIWMLKALDRNRIVRVLKGNVILIR